MACGPHYSLEFPGLLDTSGPGIHLIVGESRRSARFAERLPGQGRSIHPAAASRALTRSPALRRGCACCGPCGRGTTTRNTCHDTCKATSGAHPWRDARLSGAAAARHRGVSAHDRAAVRRAREVDQGARRGHALGYVHSARHAEERLRRRSRNRCDLRGRHARERAAAAEAARRHRQGAGRGRAARQGSEVHRPQRLLRGGRGRARGRHGRAASRPRRLHARS